MMKNIGEIESLGSKCCALLFIALLLSPFTAHAENLEWNGSTPSPINIKDGQTVAISDTISGALTVPPNATVTITGTATPKPPNGITLEIGDGATVKWSATLTDSPLQGSSPHLISLSGSGTFKVTGGEISNSSNGGVAIYSQGDVTVTVKVRDGIVQTTGQQGSGAISIFGNVEISGGTVQAMGSKAAISSHSGIKVSGGLVSGAAIAISASSGSLKISGGRVKARTAISATGKIGQTIATTIILDNGVLIDGTMIDGTMIYGNLNKEIIFYTVNFETSPAGTASGTQKISATYDGIPIQSGAKVTPGKTLVITVNDVEGGENDEYSYSWGTNGPTGEVFSIESLAADVNVTCTVTGTDKTAPVVSSVTPSDTGAEIGGSVEIAFNESMNTNMRGAVSLNGETLTGGTWTDDTTYSVSYSDLDYDTEYTIAISGFKDTAGNEMENARHTFTTETDPNPNDPDSGEEEEEEDDDDDDDENENENEDSVPNPGPVPGGNVPVPEPGDDTPSPAPGPDENPIDPGVNPSPTPDPDEEILNDAQSSTVMTNAGVTIAGVRYIIERQADGTWLIVVPRGTDISRLAITFTLPQGAACVPQSGSVQDFSGKTVVYKVTSANKTKTESYEIRVTEKPLPVIFAPIAADTTGTGWSITANGSAGGAYRVSIVTNTAATFTQIPDDIYVLMKGLSTRVAIALLDENGKPLQAYPNDPIPRALLEKNVPRRLRITGTAANRKELESIRISRFDYIYKSDPGSIFEQEISPDLTYDRIKTKFVDEPRDEKKDSEGGGSCEVSLLGFMGLAAIGYLTVLAMTKRGNERW